MAALVGAAVAWFVVAPLLVCPASAGNGERVLSL